MLKLTYCICYDHTLYSCFYYKITISFQQIHAKIIQHNIKVFRTYTSDMEATKEIFGVDNRRLFSSLNCFICKRPFEPSTSSDRSPIRLNCGVDACKGCSSFLKLVVFKDLRQMHSDTDLGITTDYALIDILQNDALTLDPFGGGYYLNKPFPVPECIVCHEQYSNSAAEDNNRAPMMLHCGHALCATCYSQFWKPQARITCPTCQQPTDPALNTSARDNTISKFLSELEDLTGDYLKNLVLIKKCSDCNEEGRGDDYFLCTDCEGKVICGTCAFRKHRAHAVIDLFDDEAKRISSEVSESIRLVCETYLSSFPEIYKDLQQQIEAFQQLALEKSDSISQIRRFDAVDFLTKECHKIRDDFENCSDDCLHNLRIYEAKIRDLTEQLGKLDLELKDVPRTESSPKVHDLAQKKAESVQLPANFAPFRSMPVVGAMPSPVHLFSMNQPTNQNFLVRGSNLNFSGNF